VSDEQGKAPGEPGGARSGSDAEAWRALILGVLERFDQFASLLLEEDIGAGRSTHASGRDGADRSEAPFAAAGDFMGQARLAFDTIIDEAGDLLWQLLGQLIMLLEAIQKALEQVMGTPPGAAPGRPSGATAREASYQPITVHFEPVVDIPQGDS
jgi:hypothetical protein